MSGTPRRVRATPDFFGDLDRQLGAERGPNGEPSRADFQAFELLRIVERFAVDWDQLAQPVPGRPDYRVLIAAGVLVRAIAVVGQLAADGAIELVRLHIDSDIDPDW